MKCMRCLKSRGCGGSRGLCSQCYVKFWKMVSVRVITWEELEKAGRCLRARPPGFSVQRRKLKELGIQRGEL